MHELRVETRRLLALLDLLESFHLEGSLKKLRKDFKRRLDAFDDLRDTQVQLRFLKPLWPEFPEAANFRALLRDREKDLVGKLSRKVKATKYSRLNRQLKLVERHLERCAGNAIRDSSGALATAAARRVFGRVAVLRQRVRRSVPSTLHRMRVAFKRFRYLNELLQPFLSHLTEERLDHMKQYQGAAGEIQDIEVLLARLAAMVEGRCLRVYEIKNLRRELLRRRAPGGGRIHDPDRSLKRFPAGQSEISGSEQDLKGLRMKLYVLRHGDAVEHGDPRYKENERPLTPKGTQRTKQLAHMLREMETTFDMILSSPLARARQTAEIVARSLKLEAKMEFTDHLSLSGSMQKLVEAINIDPAGAGRRIARWTRTLFERVHFVVVHRRTESSVEDEEGRTVPAGGGPSELRPMRGARMAVATAVDRTQTGEA